MKKLLPLLLLLVSPLSAAQQFTLDHVQGAWWSQEPGPTVAFAIQGKEVWLDYDAGYHPVAIEGDILIFDLGPDIGLVKNRIVSAGPGRLVLQHIDPHDPTAQSPTTVYTLDEPPP